MKSVKKEIKSVHSKLDKLLEGGGSNYEENIHPNHMINGRNVMRIPVRDGYQFSLDLLGMLFPRETLARGLCFVNNKSTKPPLDERKVRI